MERSSKQSNAPGRRACKARTAAIRSGPARIGSQNQKVILLESAGKDAAADQVAAPFLLMRCFRIADGLNTITRRGEIGTSVPVFGLRPIR